MPYRYADDVDLSILIGTPVANKHRFVSSLHYRMAFKTSSSLFYVLDGFTSIAFLADVCVNFVTGEDIACSIGRNLNL